MHLTDLGAQVATMGPKERKEHAEKLINGTAKIAAYTNGVCFDAAAYVTYLHTGKIKEADLTRKSGQAWTGIFAFKGGKQWDGKERIQRGKAVGFFRLNDSKIFHAGICKGDSTILAVNGGKLGAGWQAVDLKKILGDPDDEGVFDYDNAKIQVWISRL